MVNLQIYMEAKKKKTYLKIEPIDVAFNIKCLARLTNKMKGKKDVT